MRSNKRKAATPVKPKEILGVALSRFGYSALRSGQEEAIQSVLHNRDTLIVAPTGSGKSAIYQIAGLLMEGTVLVISPLIALQKDQVDSMGEAGLDEMAVVLNCTRKVSELAQDLNKIRDQDSKFVFLAPEQLAKEETLESLRQANVSLFVVDEAHCVSEWGHDFRPDYLELGHVIERLNHPTVLAMTATASSEVRTEIVSRLCMTDANILVGSFDRPNIHLRVDRFKESDKKLEALLHRVRWADKPGIIYVATRKEAESIMAGLDQEGIPALFYHGGMKASDREQVQDRFMTCSADVIVATNAFGMGIDKENVRFVYHYDTPDSLDAYYQEIGRAGRDGKPAEAILFFREEDIGSQAFHTAKGRVETEAFQSIAQVLAEAGKSMRKKYIAEKLGMQARRLTSILQQMEDAGLVEHLKSGGVRFVKKPNLETAASHAEKQQELLKQKNKDRLRQMREYADTSGCRRSLLLHYFGETSPERCGACDNCEARMPESKFDSAAGIRLEVTSA